ncbi:MotA/TolQ/ExbB proton channel family protein [bacterium]|nr:MotA/TolQ/ExbB proton channel family protein [bacterium]
MLIVERARSLYFNFKAPAPGFRKALLDLVSKGDLLGAEKFALNTAGETSVGKIAALGCHLRSTAAGEEELQARLDEKLNSEIAGIDKWTSFLAVFGNVATLAGLLGTIVGMIHSFAAVAGGSVSASDRATLLSKGIAEAMNCTAFGLIVAIPALIAYAVFQNRTDKITGSLTEMTTEIYNDLLFLIEADPAVQKSAGSSKASARSESRHAQQPAQQPVQ